MEGFSFANRTMSSAFRLVNWENLSREDAWLTIRELLMLEKATDDVVICMRSAFIGCWVESHEEKLERVKKDKEERKKAKDAKI